MNIENAEILAQKMLQVASDLGSIQNELDKLGRAGAQQITDNSDHYEEIIIKGADISYALRTLAMSFDRAALIKFAG